MNPKLEAIYALVPELKCKGKCAGSCGPIGFMEAEVENMKAKHGAVPGHLPDLTCSMLSGGRCTIYAERPLICRLWGNVRAMQCPFGCVPERFLEDDEAYGLMDLIAALAPKPDNV